MPLFSLFTTVTLAANIDEWPDFKVSLDYWSDTCGEQIPSWAAFDLMAIPARLIPSVFVADYDRQKDDLKFRFWGTTQVSVFHLDVTGKYASDFYEVGLFGPLRDAFDTMVQSKEPILQISKITTDHKQEIFVPTLRLPLSTDGQTVDGIICINEFGADKRALETFFDKLDLSSSPQP